MGEAKKSLAKRNGNHFRMFVFMGNYVSCALRVFQFEQHSIFFLINSVENLLNYCFGCYFRIDNRLMYR